MKALIDRAGEQGCLQAGNNDKNNDGEYVLNQTCQAFTRHYRVYYLQNSPLQIDITPILEVRKLRLDEIKELV